MAETLKVQTKTTTPTKVGARSDSLRSEEDDTEDLASPIMDKLKSVQLDEPHFALDEVGIKVGHSLIGKLRPNL